jgi:hypothetical protein
MFDLVSICSLSEVEIYAETKLDIFGRRNLTGIIVENRMRNFRIDIYQLHSGVCRATNIALRTSVMAQSIYSQEQSTIM